MELLQRAVAINSQLKLLFFNLRNFKEHPHFPVKYQEQTISTKPDF